MGGDILRDGGSCFQYDCFLTIFVKKKIRGKRSYNVAKRKINTTAHELSQRIQGVIHQIMLYAICRVH